MTINLSNNLIKSSTIDVNGASINPFTLDGSTSVKAAPSANWLRNKCGINTNGMYWLNPGGLGAQQFYCDFTFDNQRVWVMVIANRTGTGAVGSLTYTNATSPTINTVGTYNSSLAFNLWVGLDYWPHLGNTINQYVYSSATGLSGTHTKRSRWKFNGWSSTYAFLYPRDITNDVGSTTPGLYGYHAVNGYSLSTYNNDQDAHPTNCSSVYGNNPWWYGGCWDGNYFGYSLTDNVHWSGSSNDQHAYGAIFLSFTDL